MGQVILMIIVLVIAGVGYWAINKFIPAKNNDYDESDFESDEDEYYEDDE